jgi:hypothetical protein
LAIGLAGITLVTDAGARIDIGAEAKQDVKVRRIAFLAAGQVEGDGRACRKNFQRRINFSNAKCRGGNIAIFAISPAS